MSLKHDAAIVQDLSLREKEEAGGAQAPKSSIGLEIWAPVVLYPKKYAADLARLQRELDAQDRGIIKPSRSEKFGAAHANAYERGTWTRCRMCWSVISNFNLVNRYSNKNIVRSLCQNCKLH